MKIRKDSDSIPKPTNIDSLLYYLCATYGYCETSRIADIPPDTVDEFADAVLIAEGFDPKFATHERRIVRSIVSECFDAMAGNKNRES